MLGGLRQRFNGLPLLGRVLLGRLLALQNTHFARTIYRYRNEERQKTKAGIRQTGLQKKYALTDKPVLQQVVSEVEKLGNGSR